MPRGLMILLVLVLGYMIGARFPIIAQKIGLA